MSRSDPDPLGAHERGARVPLGYRLLTRFTSGQGARWRLAALALLLSLPAAGMGLQADDYDLARAVAVDPWSAYSFQPRDAVLRRTGLLEARDSGQVPWWIDEHFHQAFMRPISSLSLALDFALWPRAVWWMHLENGLLFAVIVSLTWSLYRRICDDSRTAGLATFLYATNPGLAVSVGWLSGRNTLLAACFGLLCLQLHQRAAEAARGAWWMRLGALAAFGCSLLSAEIGLSTLAYLVAFGATLDTGTRWARLLRLAPSLALALLWRGVYHWAGFGVVSSAYYRDPVHDPSGFAFNLITGIPTYLASQLTWPFAGLCVFSARAQLLVAVFSLLLLVALRPLFWSNLRADPCARFFALGALLATLPLGATLPQDRLVFFVAFGAGGLFARRMRELFGGEAPASHGARATLLFRIRALWTPLGFVPALFVASGLAAGGGGVVLSRALRDEAGPVVLINAPSPLPVHYRSVMSAFETGGAAPPVDVLYAGTESVFVRRVEEHALELRVDHGFLGSPVAGGLRDVRRAPLGAGTRLALPRVRVQVLEARAGDPIRVRFELLPSASGGAPRVYAWQGREPRLWSLPPVGSEVELPGLSLL